MISLVTIDPKNALIDIKGPVGSSIGVYKNDNLMQTFAASMGIVDADEIGYAHYYCAIEPKNFGTIVFKISYDANTSYTLSASISSNRFYSYDITDFT